MVLFTVTVLFANVAPPAVYPAPTTSLVISLLLVCVSWFGTYVEVTNEVVGAGYTAGGATLANKTVTVNNTTNLAIFDADDVTIANATITARGAVLYKSRGGVATSDELISYLDFNSDITATGGNFVITFDANGILTIS